MEENKPIRNEEEERPPSTDDSPQQEQQLNNPSTDESIVPAAETSDIINPTSDIKDMEVHHHAHDPAAPHHKKNWKNYFWEFLMLFLAVFCGFLAEYQLEHKIERDRTKELAKSLYEELKNDSVTVTEKSKNRVELEYSLEYLSDYFKDSSLSVVSKKFVVHFHNGLMFRAPSLFEPRTAVLEQLKNSGSLRYFKNEELQKLIGDITVAIKNINDRQSYETVYRENYIIPLLVKYYDADFELGTRKAGVATLSEFLPDYENSKLTIPFNLNNYETVNRKETNNILGLFGVLSRGLRAIQYQQYSEINSKLQTLLRKEYHLK